MMQAGMLNGAAVQQSLGLLYGTEANIPDLESQIRQLENSLCLLLGKNPGGIHRSSLENQRVPASLKYGVSMQMLAMRPDVRISSVFSSFVIITCHIIARLFTVCLTI